MFRTGGNMNAAIPRYKKQILVACSAVPGKNTGFLAPGNIFFT
jgi:hypothetical protein